MDMKLRENVIEQERRRLAVIQRIAIDSKFDEDVRERAAIYAVALDLYIGSIVLLTQHQAIFEDAFTWANGPTSEWEDGVLAH